MKLLSMMAMTLLLAAPLHADETPSDFMQRWVKAYNGNDAEVMASFYENSDEVDCLISAGLWRRGFNEIREMYVRDMKEVRFYDSVAEEMRHRLLGEDAALVSFIHKFKYEILEHKQHVRVHIRTTVTLRKVGKSWEIACEHSSPIQGIERVKAVEPPARENVIHIDDWDQKDLDSLKEVRPGGMKR